MAQTYGLAILPWAPSAGGFFAERYTRDNPPPVGSRYEAFWRGFYREDFAHSRVFDVQEAVLALAKEKGYKVVERHMMPEELANFDECFLTGTAAEVTPVSVIGDFTFKPGKGCETLINAYTEAVTPKKVAAE